MRVSNIAAKAVLGVLILGASISAAAALAPPPNDPTEYRGAPGPLAGVGLPALIVAGGAYLVLRKLRRKSD